MSNSLAIAAVTATLRNILVKGLLDDEEVAGADVTTVAPDKARTDTTNQLNLFLFQTTTNAAWRNQPMPDARNGETALPPLPLDLHYLLTAYGKADNDLLAHRLLGHAMRVYHDRPVLDPDEIEGLVPDSDLALQPEGVRITPEPLSVDEMSKLWNTFQTGYRISTGYRVSVVLLESRRPARTPLPVLRRGAGIHADATPPFPALTEAVTPNPERSARLGDTVTLRGSKLAGDTVRVLFEHPRLDAPLELDPVTSSDTEIAVALPNDAAARGAWASGLLGVSADVTTAGREQRTNAVPLGLAPRVTAIAPNPAARDPNGDVVLGLDVEPDLRPEQRISLLLGSREVPAEPVTAPGHVDFAVAEAPVGTFLFRLRVGGVDSLIVDPGADPPAFDATQSVTIT